MIAQSAKPVTATAANGLRDADRLGGVIASTATLPATRFQGFDVGAAIRRHRLEICEAYQRSGHDAALEAFASACSVVRGYVLDGAISAADAFDRLWECADNLTLVRHFGPDAVQAAMEAA